MHRRNVQRPETETRERIEHDMRLLIKHAKQDSYELLRKLARKNNQHVLEAIESFRGSKDTEAFVTRL